MWPHHLEQWIWGREIWGREEVIFHWQCCPAKWWCNTQLCSLVQLVLANLTDNRAGKYGGAVYVDGRWKATFDNTIFKQNFGTAVYVYESNVTLTGTTIFEVNLGNLGGAIYCEKSSIALFAGYAGTSFEGNMANYGGALYGLICQVSIRVYTSFSHSTASGDGGAIYALDTSVILEFLHVTQQGMEVRYILQG